MSDPIQPEPRSADPTAATLGAGARVGLDDTISAAAERGSALDPTLSVDWGQSPTLDGPPAGPFAGRRAPSVAGYEVVREVGRGGMGVVYEARNVRLNRPCALKMILAGAHASPESAVRFLVEAEAAGRLRHPNIVQVFHVGEAEGLPFVEMELVGGGGLERRLDGTPWPADRAARLVEALALGVAEAHALGVVHRDLKPANILLADDGTPKVADFGLAKFLSADTGLTRTEMILGSPSYMAPEQAAGARDVGTPADVYALGAILYQLLTGHPPFKAPTVLETLEQVKAVDAVPPSRLVPRVPRDLETICLVCLRKEPYRRYATAAGLAEDLRRYRAGESILARRSGPLRRTWRWCRRNPAVAALTASTILLLAALAAGSTAAAVRLIEERNAVLAERSRTLAAEERRREGLVDALMVAAPDGVPFLVDAIRPSRERVVPLLRRRLAESAGVPARRLRAAVALTLLGDPELTTLIDGIPSAPSGECHNIAAALAADATATRLLLGRARAATSPGTRARYASILLSLGEAGPARSVLSLGPDPAARLAFIHGFGPWHADLTGLPGLLRQIDAPAFRSGLAMAVGLIDPQSLAPGERVGLEAVFQDLYRDDPDGATHSAAGWALRRWGVEPPPVVVGTAPAPGRRWFVNAQGMTLVGIEPGSFTMGDPGVGVDPRRVTLTRPFFMGDREVSDELFERFLLDPRYPGREKPRNWPGVVRVISPTRECPVNNATWAETLLFCNWLSRREGRRPCYERTGTGPSDWRCDFAADGYRLPTAAEWEYADRAGTTTTFPIGDQPDLLPHYATAIRMQAGPGATLLPNDWGLFDMMGNIWEGVWDSTSAQSAPELTDPAGDPSDATRDMRGGAMGSGGFYTRSAMRYGERVEIRDRTRGFRVVCGPASGGSGALPADPEQAARRLIDLGRREAEAGRGKEADADFARAAALRPDDPQLFLDAGWWVVGPYPEDLATTFPPEVDPDPSRPVAEFTPAGGGSVPPLRWRPVATGARGLVDFAGVFEPSEHISAYALADVWSTTRRDAVLLIGSDDLSRVWLNGELVHEFRSPDNTATTPDAFRVTVRLRAGRNRLLAKVTNGLSPHRLYLRIVTDPPAVLDAQAEDLARSGLWSTAAAALEEADRLRPAGAPGRMSKYATALLMTDDRAGYRRLCGSIRDRAGGFTQPLAQNNLAWACSLAPGADDPGAAARLAESAVARAPTAASAAVYLNTLGAALYRADRLDEARRRLEEGIARRGGREEPSDCAFLAMIHHRQGDRGGALRWLDRLARLAPSDGANFWGERQVELLRREAEALVRPELPDLPADVFAR